MAGEISTTTSTLAGLMERMQADLQLQFLRSSRTFQAIYTQSAPGASAVQIPVVAAPSASSARTEANAVSATTVTISAATSTLVDYGQTAFVSDLAFQGGSGVAEKTAATLIQNVASGFDKAVCALFISGNYTASAVTSFVTVAAFNNGLYALHNTGYVGTPTFIGSFYMIGKIMGDGLGKYTPSTNDSMISSGYLGRYLGVDIFGVPSNLLTTDSTNLNGLMFFREHGPASGYHPGPDGGLIQTKIIPAPGGNYINIMLHASPVKTAATGGILCTSDAAL